MSSYQGNLSGCQRQRIGIARGLLGEGEVLILDESTNALDEQMKRRVVDNILSTYKNRIVVFVIHDRAIAKWVDGVLDLAIANRCAPVESPAQGEAGVDVPVEGPTCLQWPTEGLESHG